MHRSVNGPLPDPDVFPKASSPKTKPKVTGCKASVLELAVARKAVL